MCDSPYYATTKTGTSVPVPCGKCPPCKKRRVDSWAFRLVQEDTISSSSHFVTLTYNTDHVPISRNGFLTLDKKHLQLYFKRLRKLCPASTIKYYAVGEYGGKTRRPHYHLIIFNVPDTAMFFDAWHINGSPIGTVHVGTVSSDSVAYTLKYIDKPHWYKRHSRDDRQPEFSLMSKGLGKTWVDNKIVGYYQQDITRMYIMKKDGHKIALPRYYRQIIYTPDQMKTQHVQIKRAISIAEQKEKLHIESTTSMDYRHYLDSSRINRYRRHYQKASDRDGL